MSKAIKQCVNLCYESGCTRRKGTYCIGWSDPNYMWKGRACPHVSDDPDLQEKIKHAISDYAAGRRDSQRLPVVVG